jgi:uncharacterized membrane protein
MKLIFSYLLTLGVFFVVDLLWLGVIAKGIYDKHIGFLMADKVNWLSAIIFYCCFVAAIFLFVIFPAIEKDSVLRALGLGAAFGFITYATYELTNHAILKGWPASIIFIDLAWGVVLTSIVSIAGFYITKWIY